MSAHLHWRRKARLALEAYFVRRSQPRAFLTLVLSATGLVSLLASIGMFHLGVERMWLRYPATVFVGYGAFLGFLRLWVAWEYANFAPEEIAAVLPPSPDQPQKVTRVARAARHVSERTSDTVENEDWSDALSCLDGGGDGEGCFVFLLIAALIGVVGTLVAGIFAAPALLAEVFLDAFLITVIYQRLRVKADEHWLRTAIGRTWLSAAGIAVLLSIAGGTLTHLAPFSTSLGEALHYLAESREAKRGR